MFAQKPDNAGATTSVPVLPSLTIAPSTPLGAANFASSSSSSVVTPVASQSSVDCVLSTSSLVVSTPVASGSLVDPNQHPGDIVDKIGLPVYSSRVAQALDTGNIIVELDKCIEETAYHILRYGDMSTKSDFAVFGRKIYERYPCIHFPCRLSDSTPWVSHCHYQCTMSATFYWLVTKYKSEHHFACWLTAGPISVKFCVQVDTEPRQCFSQFWADLHSGPKIWQLQFFSREGGLFGAVDRCLLLSCDSNEMRSDQ